jgi:hypothetical protein
MEVPEPPGPAEFGEQPAAAFGGFGISRTFPGVFPVGAPALDPASEDPVLILKKRESEDP